MHGRVIGYYQTFNNNVNFSQLCAAGLTAVHLASLHFGLEPDGQPYMHLNNLYPLDPALDFVWDQMGAVKASGGKVMLMIGGAGGGYSTFLDPHYTSACTALLLNLLNVKRDTVDGVDLDVEEPVNLDALLSVVSVLRSQPRQLAISFAPIASSLQSDAPGLGGFSYGAIRDLGCVAYFNGQFYGAWGEGPYSEVVSNGYVPQTIVMGASAGQANATLAELAATIRAFPDMGGVYIWEIGAAEPTPLEWVRGVSNALKQGLEALDERKAPAGTLTEHCRIA